MIKNIAILLVAAAVGAGGVGVYRTAKIVNFEKKMNSTVVQYDCQVIPIDKGAPGDGIYSKLWDCGRIGAIGVPSVY